MKKIIAAGIPACALLSVPGFAADMPVKAPPLPTVYNWTSCYVGANTGGAWADKSITTTIVNGIPTTLSAGSLTATGWAYGGQVGCDYQLNNVWVLGLRGTVDGSNMTGKNTWPTIVTDSNQYKIGSFETVVGTVGYLLTPTVEVYALGGGAGAQETLNWSNSVFGIFGSGSQTRAAYDVGAGMSWMFAPHWNLSLEYDYMGFGTQGISLTGTGGTGGANVRQSISTFLLSLDYRFR